MEEPFEVTVSAFVAEPEADPGRANLKRWGGVCRGLGFAEVACGGPGRPGMGLCPLEGFPAKVLTFTGAETTVLKAAQFTRRLRAALARKVAAGTLARFSVEGWGSWRLTSHVRYENYYDFDADAPFRFMLGVPPYNLVAKAPRALPPPPRPLHDGAPRISLVLDLDETLIHTEVGNRGRGGC